MANAQSPAPQALVGTNTAPIAGALTEPDTDALLKRLAAAEAKAAEQDAEIEKLRREALANLSGRSIQDGGKPLTMPGGSYRFAVGPVQSDKYPDLPRVEVEAVDESEALRWYCVTHDHPKGSKKQVDPVRVHLKAACLDNARAKKIMFSQKIAALRNKLSVGSSLSEEDQALVSQFEALIYGFASQA